jgi:CBS domain-containing membrane protein
MLFMNSSKIKSFSLAKQWLGVEIDAVSNKEKIVSMLGGFLAIALIVAISHNMLHFNGASMIIASTGASAVLLFAVPHGQLSQPWPVVAGHLFSAIIGVTCAKLIPSSPIAAGCAVGLAILAMHQFKCIHPPGGATALTAVVGGPSIQALGYSFVWSPVLLNALTIVLVAIAFNFIFKWRRYPAFWSRDNGEMLEDTELEHESVVEALRSLDSFVDITEDDLLRLHRLLSAERKAQSQPGS